MPQQHKSAMRAIRRGHAVIHDSVIFGPVLLRRTGRGTLVNYFNGTKFKGKPTLVDGHLPAKGRPTSDRAQQRKKVHAIH